MKLIKFILLTYILIFCANLYSQDAIEDEYSQSETVTAADESVQAEDEQESDKSDRDKTIKLNTVVITATKTEEKLRDVPVNVNVITEDDIAATGAISAGDILSQKITGHFHRYPGLLQSIGLLGEFRTDAHGDDLKGYILILVDGHRIGTGNVAKIPPEMIERIEIIKGPSSALYGASAMGGVINFITKKGKGDIAHTVKGDYGSFNYMRTAATSGGSITDWFSYYVSASYMQVDDYETKNYGTAYNSNQKNVQTSGNLSFFPSTNQDLRIGFSYAYLIAHSPEWENYEKHTQYDKDETDYSDNSRGHADIEYNLRTMNEKLNWKAKGYYLWDRYAYYSGDPSVEDVEDDASIYNNFIIGTDQQITISFLPYNKITAGYTFESFEREAKAKKNGETSRPYSPGMTYLTNSFYLQDSIDNLFRNRLNIILGARFDRFDLSTKKPEGEYISFKEKSENFNSISPRGGIVYKITDAFRLRGNIGKAFKAPSADQLTAEHEYDGYYGPTRILGNPDLKPETSITYETGLDYTPAHFVFGTTYYYITTKDKIVKADYTVTHNGNEWDTYMNLGKSEMQSLDVFSEFAAGDFFDLPLGVDLATNITFNLVYEDKDNNEDLLYVSDKEIKSSVRLRYKTAALTLFHVYIGKQKIEDYSGMISNGVITKKAFDFYNLTCSYTPFHYLSIEGGINNLTNENYEWISGFPMPERNYKIGVTGKF